MTPAIAITAGQRRTVLALLNRHLPDTVAWVYGSRVKGTSRPTSDLDLVVFARPEQSDQVAELREAFGESNLPFPVDLFVWDETPESFRKHIEAVRVVLIEDQTEAEYIQSGWQEHRVSDLIKSDSLEIGDGYRAKNTELAASGVPFARAGNIKNGFEFDDADYFPEENMNQIKNKRSRVGDVVFTSKGTVGRFAYVRESTPRFVYSPQLCFWRSLNPELLDSRFLFYWVSGQEFFDQIKEVSGQTDMAEYVSLRDQRRMRITLPPILEQRAIAHILGTLDDKIELNRRMNETLEAMTRALFNFWFVDFDPVRAKMEGRDPGLPKSIADLFPDRLVDSELGEMPVGWTVRHLKDCFDIVMGQSPPGHTYNDTGDGLPFFQGRSDFSFRYPRNRKFCTAPNRIAEPEDTLVSVRAPVGDLNMAWERCCIGRGVAALRYRARAASFTYYTMQALQARLRKYENTGTVFSAITQTQLTRLPIQHPSIELVHAFERLARGWDETIRRNTAQINTLVALRSVLLPRLVSGYLRTRDAMKFTGRTA